MERLTYWNEEYGCWSYHCASGDAANRLAAYEDTGMMPDEIVKMGMAYEDSKRYSGRLELKLMPYLDMGLSPAELKALMLASAGMYAIEIKEFDGVFIDRLRELAKADKDGRVVVLPCKVGDKLYRVFNGNISEHQVQNMRYFARHGRLGIDTTPFFPDAEKSIGKTVFLTYEEAKGASEAAHGTD